MSEAERSETALALLDKNTQLAPADMDLDSLLEGGVGQDQFGGDIAIPFLVILQTNSPQANQSHAKYKDGAVAGMVYNTVTNGLYPSLNVPGRIVSAGIEGILCGYSKMCVEWRPNRGGFVAQHRPESEFARAAREQVIQTENGPKKVKLAANGNLVVDTGYHYFLLTMPDAPPMWTLIGMSSSQLKASRKWNSLSSGAIFERADGSRYRPSMFGIKYRLTTIADSNEKGNWFNWDVVMLGKVDKMELLLEAQRYFKAVASGEARATAPPADERDSTDDGDANEDKPF